MKIISDLPPNQKVLLLQGKNFTLNINKRMKAISAVYSAPAKMFGRCLQGFAAVGGCAYRAHRGSPGLVGGNRALAGLSCLPQSQPSSNNLKMKSQFPEQRMKENWFAIKTKHLGVELFTLLQTCTCLLFCTGSLQSCICVRIQTPFPLLLPPL